MFNKRYYHYFCVYVLLCLLFSFNVQAKKRCKPLLEKLHQIQSLQRSSYSLKRGQSLRAREDKARDKWWQCEHPSYGKSKQVKLTSKKKKKQKASKKKAYASHAKKKNKPLAFNFKAKKYANSPFKTDRAIALKSSYQGKMQQAWLNFYQQPEQCLKPKAISTFAYCSEYRIAQKRVFEQSYKE
ncbi:hypothetical protein [Colwellia sp. RSH04]|uniref:hypothetical protein n=1 Tax=Colwellia sp. RSH04 TaxID=2305464 RepID=UPI000E56C9CB|nr:hypothetical protein [Colwellia sp. RSH04]RHW76644.1 hypothetical protein D1094_06045 [Colwellia sp. RSH04]